MDLLHDVCARSGKHVSDPPMQQLSGPLLTGCPMNRFPFGTLIRVGAFRHFFRPYLKADKVIELLPSAIMMVGSRASLLSLVHVTILPQCAIKLTIQSDMTLPLSTDPLKGLSMLGSILNSKLIFFSPVREARPQQY